MSRLGIKYDGCAKTVSDLTIIGNSKYAELISSLQSVLSTIGGITYKPDTSGVSNSISKAEEHKQKLLNFAGGLDSYAESLYNFDNGFYNNFVKLDGTNSDNYNVNIGQLNISDDDIEKILLSDANSLEWCLYKLSKALRYDLSLCDDSTIINIGKKIRDFRLSDENMKALSFLLKGNSFEVVRAGKDVFIKLSKSGLDPSDLEGCARYLHDELKVLNDRQLTNILEGNDYRSARRTREFFESIFSDEGVKIYDGANNKLTGYANKLSKGEFCDLNKFIENAHLNDFQYAWKNTKDAAIDDLFGEAKYIKDNFEKAVDSVKTGSVVDDIANSKLSSKLEFAGKAFGAIDKVKTIYNNANDDLKDENGNWDFSDGHKTKEFIVDTAVDLGSSAGAAAAGAAIGSVIPGAGTVVGAVVGATIDVAINHKFGNPPESLVDKFKDVANDAVDNIGNAIGKIFW